MIVSDVDSTLMTDENIIPSEALDMISYLINHQIKIVIASGRQLNNLFSLFNPYDDKILFIAQNGSLISEGHKIIYQDIMPHEIVSKCLSYGFANNASVLLYTRDDIFVANSNVEVLNKLDGFDVSYKILADNHFNEDVFKISFFIIDGDIISLKNRINIDNIHAFISNKYMIDITNMNTNKGTALKQIQKLYRISSKKTCAFGDSENDIDMFKYAFHSYAMGNAGDSVKKYASKVAPSNNKLGVVCVLKELFSIK